MNVQYGSKNPPAAPDIAHVSRIREKFREVFGSSLTLPDDTVVRRYSLTLDGDLVMILR